MTLWYSLRGPGMKICRGFASALYQQIFFSTLFEVSCQDIFKFKVLKMCHGCQGLSHLPAMDDEPTMHMECLLIDAGVPWFRQCTCLLRFRINYLSHFEVHDPSVLEGSETHRWAWHPVPGVEHHVLGRFAGGGWRFQNAGWVKEFGCTEQRFDAPRSAS